MRRVAMCAGYMKEFDEGTLQPDDVRILAEFHRIKLHPAFSKRPNTDYWREMRLGEWMANIQKDTERLLGRCML